MPEVTDPALLAILETPQTVINAPPKPAKPLPEGARATLEQQVTALSSLDRAANLFRDNFAGFGAGIENRVQEYVDVGTEGQRDWWADFKLTDAALRNALFGASLTPGEKAAFEQTTVSPSMTPKVIRQNLERRRTLAREVLARRARSLKAGPYDPDEVTALLGEYDPDLAPVAPPPPADPEDDRREHERRNQLFQAKIKSGASYDDAARYAKEIGLEFNPEQLRQAIGQRNIKVRPDDEPSLGRQFLDATVNTVAGIGQGLAAIPDAATTALGATLSLIPRGVSAVARGVGAEGVAREADTYTNALMNPFTIGGAIERAAPTPSDTSGQVVRFGSQLMGGVAAFPQRAANAVTNALVGAVPRRPPAPRAFRPSRRQVARDARDLNIDVVPAVTGGPTTRLATAVTAQTPGGAFPIARGVERMTEQGGKALVKIASDEGVIANAETAGERAVKGALDYRTASRGQIGRLYDSAAEVAGDLRVTPEKAIQTLDENLTNLAEIPGGTEGAKYLQALRDELTGKFANGVTVQGIRGMRTQLRDKFLKDGLRGSDIERRVNEVVQSISDDLADSLTAAGKSEAADIYRQADAAWSARATILDDFIMPIIGKKGEKSGEEVFQALQRAARSNGPKLREFIGALPENEAGMVRANLINALGKSGSGAQNAAGDTFTFQGFLTRWNELGPRARNALFTGEGREAIDQLARVADQVKRASRYTNTSNTGSVFMTGLTASSGFAGLDALAGALAMQGTAGVLLASPKVAAALAKIGTSTNPGEAKEAILSLSAAAARNPALADDIAGLQQRLLESLSEPGRLAAEENVPQVRP